MTALVAVSDLRKLFHGRGRVVTAVDGVSFEIPAGSTLGLVGESGCGKSTIGRCLLRLVEPDAGSVAFDGIEIQSLGQRELRAVRRRMQMVFQDPAGSLNPAYSTAQTLEDALRPLGLSRPARRARVRELLAQVRLEERYLPRRPAEMSGGQLQRVGIARALASSPELLFLDEPTSSLDASVRGQIINLLADLQEERGLTYLFASHDLGVVKFVAHRVIVMYLGRIVEEGPAEVVFDRPAHPYTQALLVAARMREPDPGGAPAIRGELPASVGERTGCRYADRCPLVHERCREEPPLFQISNDHRSRCWLGSELAAQHRTRSHAATVGDEIQ